MQNPETPGVGDEDFMDLAKDGAKARMLRKIMENLAKGDPNDPLTEMAKEVSSGRLGIREAIKTGPYERALVSNFEKFQQRWDAMSEGERAAAEAEGRKFLREQEKEIAEERRRAVRAQGEKARHSSQGWSLY